MRNNVRLLSRIQQSTVQAVVDLVAKLVCLEIRSLVLDLVRALELRNLELGSASRPTWPATK